MGCPNKGVEKQGAGAALIKNPKLARELILKKSPKDLIFGFEIPISIKTRLGYDEDELKTWLLELLTEGPAAIVIHARTRKEMSKVPAKWERIKRAVEIRDEMSRSVLDTRTLIIGNGDVKDVNNAAKKCEESGADGAMLGRAVFGNPWLFAGYKPTTEERLKVLSEHIKLFDKEFKEIKNFSIMKKHLKEYLKDPSLRDLKFKLMRTKNTKEAEKILFNFWTPVD